MNPAFQIGRDVSAGAYKARMQSQDQSAIDNILSQAMQTNNPEVLQDVMGQILSKVSPEKQGLAVQFVQSRMQNLAQQQQNRELQKEGINPNLPGNIQAKQYEMLQNQKQANQIFGGDQGQQPQSQPGVQPVPGEQPEAGQKPMNWSDLSDEQLVKLRGVKGFDKQADTEIKRRQEAAKLERGNYEPESEKLEAKRVSELATEVENEYKAAVAEDMRIDRMNAIDKNGNVSAPAMIKVLDAFGLPIGILSNPDTEEFRKLEAEFARDVSSVFPGGKITNFELQTFMRAVPSLLNSPEGRQAVYRNRKLLNEAKRIKYDEYKRIIKENGGKKPPNLGLLLDERTSEKMLDLEDRFVSGMKNITDKYQVPIRMLDPQGNPVDIPASEIENALNAGARFR